MSLKSWTIPSFPLAEQGSPVELVLLDSAVTPVIVLTLLISNWSNLHDAHVVVERRGSDDTMKFRWVVDLKAPDSPLGIDSKMVYSDGDKLVVSSNSPDVSVEASGSEV